jgi:hypothetical protein
VDSKICLANPSLKSSISELDGGVLFKKTCIVYIPLAFN